MLSHPQPHGTVPKPTENIPSIWETSHFVILLGTDEHEPSGYIPPPSQDFGPQLNFFQTSLEG